VPRISDTSPTYRLRPEVDCLTGASDISSPMLNRTQSPALVMSRSQPNLEPKNEWGIVGSQIKAVLTLQRAIRFWVSPFITLGRR
jgi:hypothetical protein